MRKSDIRRAEILANVSKFINDLYALNDGGEFEQSFKDICFSTRKVVKRTTSSLYVPKCFKYFLINILR